ncbi:prepilin-type N-terminal cleavage/methylation domain-containing protein [bacterium]|jgi:prepilin-type N-terminal cleavage/methylation domain-containing protein|nr:prepilin-type N-terminal cleavage/methylation domain-containing protein [bacterium]
MKLIKQAFTLIELLVVIAIIGILSGLIVVSMSGVTQKANIAKSQIFSNSLKNSLLLNLISEWRLDENTGISTYDSWSGGNTGTLMGATLPVWKTGSDCVNGSCLQFDGSDDYVDFGSNSSLSMGLGDQTISFWVRFDNAVASQYEVLAYCGGYPSGTGYPGYFIDRPIGTSSMRVLFSDGTASLIGSAMTSTNYFANNVWYNIVIVFDRDSLVQAYINGTKTSYSGNISAQQGNIINYTSYKIGTYSIASYHLAGRIDEFRLYNAIMPASQIKEQYFAGLNSLLASNSITFEEYMDRIDSLAKF